jgi:hypothetical protein
MSRKRIPKNVVVDVLTEAGYRCAVPTCRNILAIDLHHIVPVKEKGGNVLENLLALCPTCHALYERGTISPEAIYSWKGMLVSLSRAFDTEAIDNLLFCDNLQTKNGLKVSGDGVLKFSSLIAAGLVEFSLFMQNGPLLLYQISLTQKGKLLIDAWKRGDREAVKNAMRNSQPVSGEPSI